MARSVEVYDFRDIFNDKDLYFEDPDHINGNGADILIDSIKILNFGKTLSTYEKSSSFVTNAHLYMERICTNTSL